MNRFFKMALANQGLSRNASDEDAQEFSNHIERHDPRTHARVLGDYTRALEDTLKTLHPEMFEPGDPTLSHRPGHAPDSGQEPITMPDPDPGAAVLDDQADYEG
jgi:hypothetical protein